MSCPIIRFFKLRKNPFQTADPLDFELYAMGARPFSILSRSYSFRAFAVDRLGFPAKTLGRDKIQLRIGPQSKPLPPSATRTARITSRCREYLTDRMCVSFVGPCDHNPSSKMRPRALRYHSCFRRRRGIYN